MFTGKWLKAFNTGNRTDKVLINNTSSLLAVIKNNLNQVSDSDNKLDEELSKLVSNRNEYYNKCRVVSYSNKNQVLVYPIDTITKSLHQKAQDIGLNKEILQSSKITIACTTKSNSRTPFTFIDSLRDCTYSMISDGKVNKTNLLMRLTGFVEWLEQNRPETLSVDDIDDANYLFLWLVRNIQKCNGDVFSGLQKGLAMLNKSNVGGQFNLLFSDGNGVYAYTNINKVNEGDNKIAFNISRNVHNICSYSIKNCSEAPGLDWTIIKEHNLYYFPLQGAMQVYANIDNYQHPDTKFKTGVNWVCLSLISC